FLVAPVPRHPYAEHETVTARLEVRRLSAIRRAWLDVVGGADRNVELLLPVVIHVAEQEIGRSVVVLFPTLKRGPDRLAARVRLANRVERPGDDRREPQEQRANHHDESIRASFGRHHATYRP